MRKILVRISVTVVILAFLSVYSFIVVKVTDGDYRFKAFRKPVEVMVSFPKMVSDVLLSSQLTGVPSTYVKSDPEFEEFNNLSYDLYGLNSFWNIDGYYWDIKLFNFRNDEVVHQWKLTEEGLDFNSTKPIFPNAELRNSLVTNTKSLVVFNVKTPNISLIDASSNIVWQNHDLVYHHSMNFGVDSTIWVCGSEIPDDIEVGPTGRYIKNLDGRTMAYREDYLVQMDLKTGKQLYKMGVSDILIRHGYKSLVFGANVPEGFPYDPVHLNDIEPVLEDGQYWKKGDVFFSLRHKNIVVLYRPSTDEIVHILWGPFLNQHDVDIISPTEVSIFNNNLVTSNSKVVDGALNKDWPIDSVVASEVLIYNFADSTYRTYCNSHLEKDRINTFTQGFQQIFSNGDMYVEEQNSGKMYIVNESGFVMKKVFHTPIDGYIERPNWIRTFENLNF